MNVNDDINAERLAAAESVVDEDGENFLDSLNDSSPEGESEAAAEDSTGSGSSSKAEEKASDAAELSTDTGEGTEETDDVEADADPDGDSDSDEDSDDADSEDTEEEVEDAVDGPADGDEGEEDEAEDDSPEVDIDAVKQEYADALQLRRDAIANEYLPKAQAAALAIKTADDELMALEEKYKADEDGFSPSVSVADQRRIVQLENARAKHEQTIESVKADLPKRTAQAERELAIEQNLKAFPKLRGVEEGFRLAVERGINMENMAEAYEISAALMRAAGKKAAAPAAAKPKPKPGEIEKAALESSIAKKKAAVITAGKGSSGDKGASAKSDPYKGLAPDVAEGLRFWHNANRELEA